jgi:hypothetical protein
VGNFVFGEPSFPRMAIPTLFCLSLVEVAVCVGLEVLLEVYGNISLIIDDPQGI